MSPFDHYAGHSNSALWDVDDSFDYIDTVERSLAQAGRIGPFDICLYNAGMDPYQRCDIGGLDGITADVLAERERLVFEWCGAQGIPVAFVLAGGYVGSRLGQGALVELHRLTVGAASSQLVTR